MGGGPGRSLGRPTRVGQWADWAQIVKESWKAYFRLYFCILWYIYILYIVVQHFLPKILIWIPMNTHGARPWLVVDTMEEGTKKMTRRSGLVGILKKSDLIKWWVDTGRNIWFGTQKNLDPTWKLHTKNAGNPTQPEHDPTMSWVGREPILFYPKPDPTDDQV